MDFETVWAATEHIVSGVTKNEARVLYDLAAAVRSSQSGSVAEIGSYLGKSAAVLASTGPIWSVDHHRGNSEHQPGMERYRPGTTVADRVDTFPFFEENLTKLGLWNRVHAIVTDHMAALRLIPTSALPIRVLFVDAEHTYEANRCIIDHWLPKVDGVVAFHDYTDEFPGMVRSIDEARPRLGDEVTRVDSLIVFRCQAIALGLAEVIESLAESRG